ncbi:MAG: tripartite tricarboxylate transporter TctB family protein [Moorella sp. (in: Bacteria)]|nr:tripartite tricarboxylate transporter TctB family protein [Moorella sp. (in: firmicutes)]
MPMWNSDRLAGIIFLIIGLLALYGARELSHLGGVFPRTASMLVIFFSVLLLINSLRDGKPVEKIKDPGYIITVTILAIIYIAIMPYLGFLLTSIVFISLMAWMLNSNRQRGSAVFLAIVAGASISIGFYAVFSYILSVPLPGGVFFQ